MIRAEAPPIAPASCVSANWTSPASAGSVVGCNEDGNNGIACSDPAMAPGSRQITYDAVVSSTVSRTVSVSPGRTGLRTSSR